MGRVYHHTTGQDIEDTILGLYGLVKSSNIHILGTKKCVECQHINLGIVTSFQKCGSLLEEKNSEESINVEKLESEEKT